MRRLTVSLTATMAAFMGAGCVLMARAAGQGWDAPTYRSASIAVAVHGAAMGAAAASFAVTARRFAARRP
jgi:hypothetical protein